MSASQSPPSHIPGVPPKSGAGPYIVGTVVLGALGVALFVWKSKQVPPPVSTEATAAAVVSAAPPGPQLQFAPPPPPKLADDEPDAGAPPPKPQGVRPAGVAAPTATAVAGACGGKCDGPSNGALNAVLRSTAQSAQGCYHRALRNSEASGTMTVSVQVGPSGSVCSATLANDTVHSSEIASCVLSRFQGKNFPAPNSGCTTVNIPITFKITP